MAGMNNLVITGNLTRDPELRTIQSSGTEVCNMGVACNGFKDGDVQFFDVSVWGKAAQACATHLEKGSSVCVSGRVKLRTWEKQDGSTGAALQLDARDVTFLGSPNRNGGNGGQTQGQGQGTPPAQPPAGQQNGGGQDDIPF